MIKDYQDEKGVLRIMKYKAVLINEDRLQFDCMEGNNIEKIKDWAKDRNEGNIPYSLIIYYTDKNIVLPYIYYVVKNNRFYKTQF